MTTAATKTVLDQVAIERTRQDEKWGVQDHPDGTGAAFDESALGRFAALDVNQLAERMIRRCNEAHAAGVGTYEQIITEEWAEVISTSDRAALRVELIQLAAVAVAWVEKLDREGDEPDERRKQIAALDLKRAGETAEKLHAPIGHGEKRLEIDYDEYKNLRDAIGLYARNKSAGTIFWLLYRQRKPPTQVANMQGIATTRIRQIEREAFADVIAQAKAKGVKVAPYTKPVRVVPETPEGWNPRTVYAATLAIGPYPPDGSSWKKRIAKLDKDARVEIAAAAEQMLPEREADVLRRSVIGEEHPNAIGASYEITGTRVAQIRDRAVRKLRYYASRFGGAASDS